MPMDKQTEFVLRTIEERDIRFVRLWFTDVLGTLKSVAVAPAELEGAFAAGLGFGGSAIEGFARVYESDMLAKPDPSTFAVLPWRAESPGVARMFCDILMPDGTPSYADPRYVLKRALSRAADMGFTFYTHPEVAGVGKTEEELVAAGIPYRKGAFPYMANGRAKALGANEGKVKILAHKDTDRILGVHIVGARAGDLIAEAVAAIEFGASSEDLARTSHAHPTLAEVMKEAALAVDGRALHI